MAYYNMARVARNPYVSGWMSKILLFFFISFSMKSLFGHADILYARTCQRKNKSFRVDSHFMTVASLGQPQEY